MNDVTRIINRIHKDGSAADELMPLVYEELKRLAASKLVHEKPGQTLQTTSLVHEAYVRLVDVKQAQQFESRGHFFAAAAEAMRRILVEQARRRQSLKRGGEWNRIPAISLNAFPSAQPDQDERVLAIHDAMEQLEQSAPRQCEIVKLRFFVGMTVEETANVLAISTPTVKREWAAAKVWIYRLIQGKLDEPDEPDDSDGGRENSNQDP